MLGGNACAPGGMLPWQGAQVGAGETLNAPFIPAPPATLLQVRQTELPRLLGSRWQRAQRS